MSRQYPLFVRGDLDGFFGLLIDNLVQLLLIPAFCAGLCGMSGEDSRFIYTHILPGAALSILFGNVFYAWQAHRLAAREQRSDVTALPYGINTPSMLVYVFFVMAPEFAKTGSAESAWRMGLFACLGSGVIEFAGAFVAGWVRRKTPRAALLSTLAGIAIGFISMTFALQIFQKPLVAMLPFAIILISLFSRSLFPLGLPGGLVAILAGTGCAWLLPSEWTGVTMSVSALQSAWAGHQWQYPHFAGAELAAVFDRPIQDWLGYMSVIVPMGLFNVIGSLQNIESAEAGGDRFDTFSSLSVNGVGTIMAALFGSCFPTTIYIGHPGWKGLGARAGYSTLNGLVITLICLSGTVSLMNAAVPVEAGIPIVLWVGIIITAQAFQATPSEHAPAVAMGLFPALAAWGATVVQGAFILAGNTTIQDALTKVAPPFLKGANTEINGFLLQGLIIVERGYIFTCMFLAAIAVFLIERKYYSAGIWSLVAATFAAIGLTHAYQIDGNTIDYLFNLDLLFDVPGPAENVLIYRAFPVAVGYLLAGACFFGFGMYRKRFPDDRVGH